jgi:hypothetical protein
VEEEVLADELAEVGAVSPESIEAIAACQELHDGSVGDLERGAARRVAFEERAQLVEIVEIACRMGADGGAPVLEPASG